MVYLPDLLSTFPHTFSGGVVSPSSSPPSWEEIARYPALPFYGGGKRYH